ncbi:phosphoenolpyrvate carboxykinase [Thermoplasma volcanium GSS1]|uniref:Phosphoenolpyruvate carboxykinase [GTP] n=1 Tax=Thermoplasma volcanium (strain ATCC 51530 / DSM 4299 / JCM 9571 / NBRC 15438 / GSS1) TaxID=273116 RepID=PCKG_THEVO|nr:phosphoenolpyruvate carboxykinase (GTP) [Thermoplasma volcanium]P58306.1 RecName: Full=Phosphoenolpyruvate carboxykinase [GTP]; Short=PEP carboxykinase; Short=PEPCK [Thermoplasma volcanium GSS1]BAB59342.1 phosphoenolpyrvate carboxykinase [Thermoplasma volcanium GSS1]
MLALDETEINDGAKRWIVSIAKHLNPSSIYVCDGTKEEFDDLASAMVKDGEMIKLNEKNFKNSYLYRSNATDVARTEERTFISARDKSFVGPLNNFLPLDRVKQVWNQFFKGAYTGKTMFVIPYALSSPESKFADFGIEVTDSKYVVLNLHYITRMGKGVIEKIGDRFIKGVHATGNLDPGNKFIIHMPWEKPEGVDADILSVNTNYGGNALLSKKCHALRIASVRAREEGWLAEHMLLLEVKDPQGKSHFITGAFPSASGKTNLAMISPPKDYRDAGWSTRLISDDISWIKIVDGKFMATNPENGFFAVVPGTNYNTNKNAMATLSKNTIFTNVGLTMSGDPWWEGLDPVYDELYDWKGNKRKIGGEPIAHPNSRYTSPLTNYPYLSDLYEDPEGVPVSAILFGGRRATLIPLVFEAFNWNHGVFLGATMGVERTAASEGKVGDLRRDPMAMRPFCGYNINEYFRHWIEIGERSKNKPKIFYVNWFRRRADGTFIWPGFAENFRVLEWIIYRTSHNDNAVETPIGYIPESLNLAGLNISEEDVKELFRIDKEGWKEEMNEIQKYFSELGNVPEEILKEFELEKKRLGY